MILQLNHLQRKPAASTTQEVVDTLYSLLEEGRLEQEHFARLRVHLRKNRKKECGRYSHERPIKGLTKARGASDTGACRGGVYSETSFWGAWGRVFSGCTRKLVFHCP
jgi:hypothetical protein